MTTSWWTASRFTAGQGAPADFLKYGKLVAHVQRRGVDLADVILVQ